MSRGVTRGFYEPFQSAHHAGVRGAVLVRRHRFHQAPNRLSSLTRETLLSPLGSRFLLAPTRSFGLVPAIFVPEPISPLSVTGFPAGWRQTHAQGRP